MTTPKFSQVAVTSKEFNMHKEVSDLMKNHAKEILVSCKIFCKKGKVFQYIQGDFFTFISLEFGFPIAQVKFTSLIACLICL